MGLAAAGTAAATALGVGATTAGVIGTGVATAAAVGGGLLASQMLAPKMSIPTPPPGAAPPPTAPTLNTQAIARATQQQTALAAAMSGRQATVLSQTMGSSGGNKLG